MTSTSSDTESEADSKDKDEVFYKLFREELFQDVKYLINHCHFKSEKYKVLQKQYDLVTEEARKVNIVNEIQNPKLRRIQDLKLSNQKS